MKTLFSVCSQTTWEKLSSLKNFVGKQRKRALHKRLTTHPHPTDLEYLLGAFIEMYEPHLEKIIYKLSEKGYAADPSSGFGGKNSELQVMNGYFAVDYVTRNKLEKIGVKFREYNGFKSLIFWPGEATLENINTNWMQIIGILPDKGVLSTPSMSSSAIKFRRKYIPEHLNLQRQRLFEKLKYQTQKKVENATAKRKAKNPHPDKKESLLGLFFEELEPQVKQAVLTLHKKGYSTDVSGFMENSCNQMIEGDFQLDEKTVVKLTTAGVTVETNPSGYTRLQFLPNEANIAKIKKKWNSIISLIPDKKQVASPSMTRKARDFRTDNL